MGATRFRLGRPASEYVEAIRVACLESEYILAHTCCPACGSEHVEQNCGPVMLGDENRNGARCPCGWRGLVHDLLPRTEGG